MDIIALFENLEDFKNWWKRSEAEDDPTEPHAEAKKRLVSSVQGLNCHFLFMVHLNRAG